MLGVGMLVVHLDRWPLEWINISNFGRSKLCSVCDVWQKIEVVYWIGGIGNSDGVGISVKKE